jgi:hypothetical protein
MFNFNLSLSKRGNNWHIIVQGYGWGIHLKCSTALLVQIIAALMFMLNVFVGNDKLSSDGQPPPELTPTTPRQVIIDMPKHTGGAAAPNLHEH